MNFNSSFVLFVYFSLLEYTKCKQTCFMTNLYNQHSENLYIYFQMQNTGQTFLITLAKTGWNVLRLNMTSSSNFSFIIEKSYNRTVIEFNLGRHKDLFTLKSDIYLGLVASENVTFFGQINHHVYRN